SIQSFGLGFDEQSRPVVVAFYRYLANLTPEHQQYWNSFRTFGISTICRQYYQSSILGQFWENRSVRYAIQEEMRLINELTTAILGRSLFRLTPDSDSDIDLTNFLRPTSENFD